jgi:hypothetical protein
MATIQWNLHFIVGVTDDEIDHLLSGMFIYNGGVGDEGTEDEYYPEDDITMADIEIELADYRRSKA